VAERTSSADPAAESDLDITTKRPRRPGPLQCQVSRGLLRILNDPLDAPDSFSGSLSDDVP